MTDAAQPHPSAASLGAPRLIWDLGTAYDLFISLHVLHHPEKFGLRANWAAGVRSRLSSEDRQALETAERVMFSPLVWTYHLPEPKDSLTALYALRQLAPAQRLPALSGLQPDDPAAEIYHAVSRRGTVLSADGEALRAVWAVKHKERLKVHDVQQVLAVWTDAAGFGERYLQAMNAYYQNFFAEEERRILPALQAAQAQAQAQAERLPLSGLVPQLSRGVQMPDLEARGVILAPSYWATPLVFFADVAEQRLLTYGARPDDASLIPGEIVPDALIQALKALADPTRLRILRYLSVQPLTPAELARRLRLRPPTVIHHLSALRVAGLVQFTLAKDEERRYAARSEAIQSVGGMLAEFMHTPDSET